MKTVVSLLMFLAGVTRLAHASDLPAAEVLITGCGEFVLASDLTLNISADGQQGIYYDLKQTSQGPGGLPVTTTEHSDISGGAGAKFLFCWQPTERRLWWASADSLDRCMYSVPVQVRFQSKQIHYSLHDGRNLPNVPSLLAMAIDKTFPR